MGKQQKRPDTPLAATPDPISMRDELIARQVRGGAMKLFENKRNAKKAQEALKEAQKSSSFKNAGDAINAVRRDSI